MILNFRKTILIITIVVCLIPISSALIIDDADWTQKEEITLEWGDNYSTGNYTILAEDFNKQAVQVILTIYKNNEKIHTVIMSAGETVEVSTIKITINSIGGCTGETEIPYATMTIYTMKPPAISLDVKNSMATDGLANITIILENTGGIRFFNITLNVTLPDDLIPYKDNTNKYQTSFDFIDQKQDVSILNSILENISIDSKESRWVKVEVPALPQEIEIPIHIEARGYDLDNRLYDISKDVNISIEPAIKVTKVPLHKMVNTGEDYFYMNDRVYVLITVYNSATTDAFNVTINETIMTSNFVMDPDSRLDWTFDLPARQSTSFNYYLRPVRPGGVQISTTSISRKYKGHLYTKTINSTTAKIYGPYFEISKNLDNYTVTPHEIVKVTVVAENTGNHAGYLILTDDIPAFAQLIDGSLNTSGVVKPGNKLSINYTIKMQRIGEFRFPSAIGRYNDLRHYSGVAYSTRPLIHVLEYMPAPTLNEPVRINNSSSETNNSGKPVSNNIPGFCFLSVSAVFMLFYVSYKKRKR